MALGAPRAQVLWMVLRETRLLAFAGLLSGARATRIDSVQALRSE